MRAPRHREQRALRLKAHLEWLANGPGPTPRHAWETPAWHRRPGAPLPDAVYMEPDVIPWSRERQPPNPQEDARQAIARLDGDLRSRVSWANLWPDVHRAVVLGRPGEGKSTLLQRTCRQVAVDSLKPWEDQRTPLDEIPVPLWLTADQVIRAGSVERAVAAAREPAGSGQSARLREGRARATGVTPRGALEGR